MIPTDPAGREAMAGEYVLGTLDAHEAHAVERAMEADPAFRALVEAWQARLAPLVALATPESPPPGLWERIEAVLDGARPPVAAPMAKPSGFWRFWAFGASAVAAGLALFLVVRPVPQPPLMTVLLTQQDQPAWLVEADGGALRLAALNPQPVPPDRVMQLWALPQGASAPTSLGLIPVAGRLTVTPSTIRPEPGMLIEITLEPPGGSPTGRPTGPILFIGRLLPARGT
ncbi:anti-sigma factor [Roseomonas fluvialis]|uniref:Regulator of SigK n=1 Tax=Roseomonas fluvialis TaxID=1750527 RepID=A0ABM7YA40_9PROT|nr:anti-sigma factor [Roseomonas fluvialis]BDG74904.1 DNA-directed RNA polymerase sigma-70 factor [Roseomonas fluvialis]